MNREQALAELKAGKKVKRIGSSGHWFCEQDCMYFVSQTGRVTPAWLAPYHDYELMPEEKEGE